MLSRVPFSRFSQFISTFIDIEIFFAKLSAAVIMLTFISWPSLVQLSNMYGLTKCAAADYLFLHIKRIGLGNVQ
jgi:hypothetical protein